MGEWRVLGEWLRSSRADGKSLAHALAVLSFTAASVFIVAGVLGSSLLFLPAALFAVSGVIWLVRARRPQ